MSDQLDQDIKERNANLVERLLALEKELEKSRKSEERLRKIVDGMEQLIAVKIPKRAFQPGEKVRILHQEITAIVESVTTNKAGTCYKVYWWVDGRKVAADVDQDEITNDYLPMPGPTVKENANE